jgi:hypothetical protein
MAAVVVIEKMVSGVRCQVSGLRKTEAGTGFSTTNGDRIKLFHFCCKSRLQSYCKKMSVFSDPRCS